MDGSPPELLLGAVGPPLPGTLAGLAARLSRRVAAPCRVIELGAMPLPRLPDRDQLDADRVVAALEERAAAGDGVLLGVTALDAAVPVFSFVFGRARLGGRAALVSLARLTPAFYGLPPDPQLLLRRAADEALHELGHTAALPHCPDASCLMRFAGTVEKADVRGSRFCDACRSRLPGWLQPAPAPLGRL
jgi:archaemetzincin